ncbi:MAG TPA: helix-turn-helix domain-containing protein [Caulobacteraceae bacterium]|jgi:CRP-like cAMP-binding protein|nr:helix-turn-helix domain-containing protein [Caulobacteraceae bacterium]
MPIAAVLADPKAQPPRGNSAPRLAGLVDGTLSNLGPGERVFDEEDRADCLYEVVGGIVRTLHVGPGGGRTIYGFFISGEIFGLESRPAHRCSAEAVGEASVARYKRAHLEKLALVDRTVATQLWSWLTSSGEQASVRQALLARGNAVQKIAQFLLEMARTATAGGAINLPMSRYDIADYLGLSSETVSRTFTDLRRQTLIAVEGRTIRLLKPLALRQLVATFN